MEKGNKLFDVQFEDAFMCAGTSCTSDPARVATVVSGKFDLTRLFYVAVNTCACVCGVSDRFHVKYSHGVSHQ